MNIKRYRDKSFSFWLRLTASVFFITYVVFQLFIVSTSYLGRSILVVKSAEQPAMTQGLASLLPSSVGQGEMSYLKEYVRSTDMFLYLIESGSFIEHYSDKSIDKLSRLPLNASHEKMYAYFAEKVINVAIDETSQVLILEVKGFAPEYVQYMSQMIIDRGEAFVNELNREVAASQLTFLEKQVEAIGDRVKATRRDILKFQFESNLVSPLDDVSAIQVMNAELEAEKTQKLAEREVLASFHSELSPQVKVINKEIDVIDSLINSNKAKIIATDSGSLGEKSAKFSELTTKLEFEIEMYSGALASLEAVRVETARKLQKVGVLQSPNSSVLEEYPKKLKNVFKCAVFVVFFVILFELVFLVFKGHKD